MGKKILYVITKASWGGAQKYVYDMALAAREAGYEVAVAYGEPGLLTECLEVADVRTIAVPELGRNVRLGQDIASYYALKKLFAVENPDVVHLNSSKAGFVGARAAKELGIKKRIFTAHGWAFNEPRNFVSRKIFEELHRKTALWCTDVIAVSDSVFGPTLAWGLPEGRVHLIRLGMQELGYLSHEEACNWLKHQDTTLANTADGLWVGTIAELHRNKGLDVGIAGWRKAKLPKAHWIILGGGEEIDNLKKQAKGDPTIHFLGFVFSAAQYVKAFDLFLLPSRTEALAYVILEAGLAGVPVLTSGVGGTKEAVGEDYEITPPEYQPAMGFFKPEDPEHLAQMLKIVTRDRNNLRRVGENLASYVKANFSFKEMVAKTLALYA